MRIDFSPVLSRLDYLLEGLAVTVLVDVAAIFLRFALGLLLAICRISRTRGLRIFASVYIDVFRNTPFIVQLFFLYYGLPEIGIPTDPMPTGILALSLACAAGNAEIIRAGIETVSKGIVDAGRSFGMSGYQIYRYLILPNALRIAWRPLGNAFVNLVLTTSVLSTITVNDLAGNAANVSAETFKPFEVYLTVLVTYCAVTFTVSGIVNSIYALLFSRVAERPVMRGHA
ncbi:MAG: amino acid ABC transporter permease [Devosia sp.]|nr:amino acid ABC transporter permease [Devosia sp.]